MQCSRPIGQTHHRHHHNHPLLWLLLCSPALSPLGHSRTGDSKHLVVLSNPATMHGWRAWLTARIRATVAAATVSAVTGYACGACISCAKCDREEELATPKARGADAAFASSSALSDAVIADELGAKLGGPSLRLMCQLIPSTSKRASPSKSGNGGCGCESECAEAEAARQLLEVATPAPAKALLDCSVASAGLRAGQQWTGPELMINWSATHSARAARVYFPETEGDVCSILQSHFAAGAPIRPVGSCISPNGLGLPRDGGASINLAMMDHVIGVDKDRGLVRVQAGAKVSSVVDALREHDLTLENFASISDQQMGGFTQVSAHGTGARIAPVDDQVVALRLVVPNGAVLALSADAATAAERRLFRLARTGLGALGVVTELTVRVVRRHLLREASWAVSRAEASNPALHAARLRRHRHLRYMWIPYTDTVVIVASDVAGLSADGGRRAIAASGLEDGKDGAGASVGRADCESEPSVWPCQGSAEAKAALQHEAWALEPLRELFASVRGAAGDSASLNFAQLRGALLASGPLNLELVKSVNRAEAAFWRRLTRSEGGSAHKATMTTASTGPATAIAPSFSPEAAGVPAGALVRVDWSDRVLGFECGGSQWVSEVALPAGTVGSPSGAGVEAVEAILADVVEGRALPAPAPIEQRWTAASESPLSPATIERWDGEPAGDRAGPEDALFSWIGIIQYMPKDDDLAQRAAVTAAFKTDYEGGCRRAIWPRFRAAQHWAKIETDMLSAVDRRTTGERLARDFDLKTFEAVRQVLDPTGILANDRLLATVAAAQHRYAGSRS